jgi:hypothetical protein
LAVTNVSIDGSNVADVSITVSLCPGSGYIPVAGTVVSFDAKPVSLNGIDFGSDGAGGGGSGVLIEPDGSNGGSWLIYQGYPIPNGTWTPMGPFTMPGGASPNMTSFTIRFHAQGNSWYGSIYLDNISIAH